MAELPTPLHRSMVQFAYYTGWRRGEIVKLTWNQISWESKVLRIDPPTENQRTKGADARVIPFAKTPLEGLLKERWKQREGLFVFHRHGARPDLHKVWKAAYKRAGLDGWRPHDFRRTAAWHLVNVGVLKTVPMQIVGWKTRATFDCYHKVNEAHRAEATAQRLATANKG